MPIEYLAPGVYVEEIEGGVREIDGVPTSTSGFTGAYAHAITIPVPKPAWTDPHQGDPGITLVDLLAWIGEAVLYRRGAQPRPTTVNVVAFVSTEPFDTKLVAGVLEGLCVVAKGEGKPGLSVGPGVAIDDAGNVIGPGDGGLPESSQRVGVKRTKDP